jgi:hypothetical protein
LLLKGKDVTHPVMYVPKPIELILNLLSSSLSRRSLVSKGLLCLPMLVSRGRANRIDLTLKFSIHMLHTLGIGMSDAGTVFKLMPLILQSVHAFLDCNLGTTKFTFLSFLCCYSFADFFIELLLPSFLKSCQVQPCDVRLLGDEVRQLCPLALQHLVKDLVERRS